MTRRRAGCWALVLCALTFAACDLLPGPGPVVRLENMTNSPATVEVNGSWAGTYAAGTSADVPLAGHGQAPFTVTVRTPNGIVATQLEVTAADVEASVDVSGAITVWADLPCGRIRLSFGQSAEPQPAVAFADLPACP